jgi:hypothetical protein
MIYLFGNLSTGIRKNWEPNFDFWIGTKYSGPKRWMPEVLFLEWGIFTPEYLCHFC